MLAVEDDRAVFKLSLRYHLLFLHIHHVAVAGIVVPHILLIEIRQRAHLVFASQVLPVPVHHHVLSVEVEGRPQHENHFVENGVDLQGRPWR